MSHIDQAWGKSSILCSSRSSGRTPFYDGQLSQDDPSKNTVSVTGERGIEAPGCVFKVIPDQFHLLTLHIKVAAGQRWLSFSR